jgi:hypothetical protein
MASVLSDLTSTLTSALSNLPSPDKIQDADLMQLLGVLGQLQVALEPPQLPIGRFCFSVWHTYIVYLAEEITNMIMGSTMASSSSGLPRAWESLMRSLDLKAKI